MSYDWSGVYVRVRFKGPSIAIRCSDTKNSWFNLWIDREMDCSADKTYASITARYFNADFNLVSHSGQGIARNYDDAGTGYNMPDRYSQTFDTSKEYIWSSETAPYRPDVVVIYLCTNDFSTDRQPHETLFIERYIQLLNKVKMNYGEDIPVLCMASNVTPYSLDYGRSASMMSGLKNVSYMGISRNAHNYEDELGASWHPNYKGHKKVASCYIYLDKLGNGRETI